MVTRTTWQRPAYLVLGIALFAGLLAPAWSDGEPTTGARIAGRVLGLAEGETARVEIRRREGLGAWGWGGIGPGSADPRYFERWLDDEVTTGSPLATANVSGKSPAFTFEPLTGGHYAVRTTRSAGRGTSTVALWHDGRRDIAGLLLPPGDLRLRVRLTRSNGSPFRGLVRAYQPERSFLAAPVFFRAATLEADEEGKVEFAGLELGPVHLVALVPGRLRVRGPTVPLPHEETLGWTVDPGAGISGIVRRLEDDEPVAGARVFACRADRAVRAVAHAETDEAGAFRLPVGGEDTKLLVLAPGLAPGWIEAGDTTDLGAIRLASTATISGWVRDPGGDPIPDVRVIAEPTWPYRADRPSLETRTDAGGRYRLDAVPPGEVRVYAHDHAWVTPTLVDEGWTEYDLFTTVVEPGERRRIDFDVVPAARILGRVLDDEGRPVSGAGVWACPGEIDREATTDAAGAFVLDGLVPGQTYRIGAGASGRERTREETAMAGTDSEPVLLRFEKELRLEVEAVSDEDEAPLPGVRVVVHQSYEKNGGEVRTSSAPVFTNAQGRAGPSRLRAGPSQIEVSAPGWAEEHRKVALGGSTKERFRLKRAPAPPRLRIQGRVEAPTGADPSAVELRHSQTNEPLIGRWEEDGGHLVPVRPDGSFAFEVDEAGRYGLRARVAVEGQPYVYWAEAACAAGDTEVVVRLRPAPWLRDEKPRTWTFRIVDHENDLVPTGFVTGPHALSSSPSTHYFHNGHLRVSASEEIEKATFTFHALDACGIWLPLATTVVGPVAPGSDVIEVVLAREVPIQGTVLDPEGRGVPGLRIWATPIGDLRQCASGSPRERTTRTLPDGRFRLGGLGDVPYLLHVDVPTAMAPVPPLFMDVGYGRHTEFPIRLHRAVAPKILIVDPQGTPLAGAGLEIQPDESDFSTFSDNYFHEGFYSGPGYVWEASDAEGKVAFTRLDPQRGYVLWISPPKGRDDLAPRYFGAWKPKATQRIELFPWAELRGRVADESGAPVADAIVYARQPGEDEFQERATSDAEGRFHLPRLRRGAVTLRAHVAEDGIPRHDLRPGLLHTATDAGEVILVVER